MTREEAKEIMLKLLSEITKDFDVLEDEEKEAFNKAIEALEQEQTGHWIIDKGSLDAFYGEVCKCSECGVESIGESDYCPYCGARMESNDVNT